MFAEADDSEGDFSWMFAEADGSEGVGIDSRRHCRWGVEYRGLSMAIFPLMWANRACTGIPATWGGADFPVAMSAFLKTYIVQHLQWNSSGKSESRVVNENEFNININRPKSDIEHIS